MTNIILLQPAANIEQIEPDAFAKENQILKVLPLFLTAYPSNHTRIVYKKSVEEFLQFWEKKGILIYELRSIQRFHLDAWQRFLESATQLCPASISTKVAALLSFTRFATENGWIEKNPGEFVKLPKISRLKGKTEALSEEEIRMLLENLHLRVLQASKPTYVKEDYRAWLQYGIFLTLATVGMRCSELVNLKLSDLTQSGSYYRLHLSLKGGEQHAPLIPQFLSNYLLSFIKKCRSFAGQSDPIFSIETNSNEKISREYLSKIISTVSKCYGIEKKISAHSLRATVASLLHKNKIPVGEIKDLLGHKSILTTMMYVRKTDEENESAALKNPISNMFKS